MGYTPLSLPQTSTPHPSWREDVSMCCLDFFSHSGPAFLLSIFNIPHLDLCSNLSRVFTSLHFSHQTCGHIMHLTTAKNHRPLTWSTQTTVLGSLSPWSCLPAPSLFQSFFIRISDPSSQDLLLSLQDSGACCLSAAPCRRDFVGEKPHKRGKLQRMVSSL